MDTETTKAELVKRISEASRSMLSESERHKLLHEIHPSDADTLCSLRGRLTGLMEAYEILTGTPYKQT